MDWKTKNLYLESFIKLIKKSESIITLFLLENFYLTETLFHTGEITNKNKYKTADQNMSIITGQSLFDLNSFGGIICLVRKAKLSSLCIK